MADDVNDAGEFIGPAFNIFSMSHEERRAIMAANPPNVDLINANAYLNWSWKACGFGQLSFTFDRETGAITCSNECMSRENVRAILHAMADHIADNAILDT